MKQPIAQEGIPTQHTGEDDRCADALPAQQGICTACTAENSTDQRLMQRAIFLARQCFRGSIQWNVWGRQRISFC